jgi:glc operon protein GlcG
MAMTTIEFQSLCNAITDEVGRLLPQILSVPEDLQIANGNCVLCIMNAAGDTVLRMYGDNPIRQRQVAQVASKKALQVWLTGYATGAYEKLVYNGDLDADKFGIPHPEFIGWLGGLEAKTASGERLVLGFSGVRGEQDQGVLRLAAESLKTFSIVG